MKVLRVEPSAILWETQTPTASPPRGRSHLPAAKARSVRSRRLSTGRTDTTLFIGVKHGQRGLWAHELAPPSN
ncbi:hypothetical protein NL676_026212 [Syzygium grande]|nr:hypothetical protein NL676_026212 [Syzygium grande]